MGDRPDRIWSKHLQKGDRYYLAGPAIDGEGRWFEYRAREWTENYARSLLEFVDEDGTSVWLDETELNDLDEFRLDLDDLIGEFRRNLDDGVWPVNEPDRPDFRFFGEDDPTTGWSRESFGGIKSDDGETFEFDGYVKGRWGVAESGKLWKVTHLESGLSVGGARTFKHAKVKAAVADRIFDETDDVIIDGWALAWIAEDRYYEDLLEEYRP